MKRIIGAAVIFLLTAALGCCYFFNAMASVSAISDIYAGFGRFTTSFFKFVPDTVFGKIQVEGWFLIFLGALLLVFFLLYFLVFGLIARRQKKKRAAAVAAGGDLLNRGPELAGVPPQPSYSPLPVAGAPLPAAPGYTYQNAPQLSQKELDEEFNWRNFTGGKPIGRTIVSIILGVLLLLFIGLRFIWFFNVEGRVGIAGVQKIFDLVFVRNLMGQLDQISNNILKNLGPVDGNPGANFVVGDVINGQTLYVQDVVELVLLIAIAALAVIFYLIVATFACWCCRKPNAKKRAAAAKAQYLEDVRTGRIQERIGPSYVAYFGYPAPAVYPANPYPVPPVVQTPAPETLEGSGEPEILPAAEPTKSEALLGGASLKAGDISLIAALDPLEETMTREEVENVSAYIEDLGEGVRDVTPSETLPEPHEEREDLNAPLPEKIQTSYADVDLESIAMIGGTLEEEPAPVEPQIIEVARPALELEEVDLSLVFTADTLLEGVDASDLLDVIDFDDDGFAGSAIETAPASLAAEAGEPEEIPAVVDLELLQVSERDLSAAAPQLTTVFEPEFGLIHQAEILNPEIDIAVALSIDEMFFFPPSFELGDAEAASLFQPVALTEAFFDVIEQEPLIREVEKNKPAALTPNDFERELLERIAPAPLCPVEPDSWPREDTEIPNLGALHIYLTGEDKSIEFDREKQVKYLAPEIYELPPEEVAPEPTISQPEPVKPVVRKMPPMAPLHEIKNRENGPRIAPIPVAKKEEPVPEEEVKAPVPLAGPLHEITAASRKKDIKPVEINKDLKFNLKRFTVSTYKGNLTPEEAFARGVTKVAPVVNPVAKTAARESEIPEWMKRIQARQAKADGIDDRKIKTADEISSVWALNTKSEVVDRVNDFKLRRRRKATEEQPVPEVKKEEAPVARPARPIAPIKPVVAKERLEKADEDEKPAVRPVVKPVAPVHRPSGPKPSNIKPIPVKPNKPLAVGAPRDDKNPQD